MSPPTSPRIKYNMIKKITGYAIDRQETLQACMNIVLSS